MIAVAGDLDHGRPPASRTRFGQGNGVVHGFDPAPSLPAGPRILTGKRDTTQAQLCVGVRHCRATTPIRGRSPC